MSDLPVRKWRCKIPVVKNQKN